MVKVVGAKPGRSVFLNGIHTEPAGVVGTPFQVQTGLNTFELLRPDGTDEVALDVDVSLHDDEQQPQIIDMSQGARP